MGVTEVSLFPSNAGNNYTLWNEYNDIFYQNGTTWVYPIITVLFPPANTSKLGYSAAANRTLTAEAYMVSYSGKLMLLARLFRERRMDFGSAVGFWGLSEQ
jgi:hypothetical protein